MHNLILIGDEYQAYVESTEKLSMQISFEPIDYAKTSPFLCFTLNLGLPVTSFRDLNAFPGNTCLGVYIPADHELVVTSDREGIKILAFDEFKTIIDDHFNINLEVKAQDFSQVLIFHSTLHFTSIFSDNILLAMKTPILTLTKSKIDDILAKENGVLKKIKQVMAFIGLSHARKRSLSDFIFGPSLSKYSILFQYKV